MGKSWMSLLSFFSSKNGANATVAAATDHQLKGVEPEWVRNGSSSPIPPNSPLLNSFSILKLLQVEDEGQNKAKILKPRRADKTVKMVSFSRFVIKKWFIKTKSANETENNTKVDRIAETENEGQTINASPLRTRSFRSIQRLKMAQSLTKITRRQKPASRDKSNEILAVSEKEFRGGEELCKKRILMGEKCKPLMGGILRYDKDGVLIPDFGL